MVYGESKNKYLKQKTAINLCGGGGKNIRIRKYENRKLGNKVRGVTIFKIKHVFEFLTEAVNT